MSDKIKAKILLVVPVLNEEAVISWSIHKLYKYMNKNCSNSWNIIIAENGSHDKTPEIADCLAKELSHVAVVHIKRKRKGNALQNIWSRFDADVYAYTDVDHATGINALQSLFQSILDGYDIAVGSRYLRKSKTKRTIKRWLISQGLIFLIKFFLIQK